MNSRHVLVLLVTTSAATLLRAASPTPVDHAWPQWRGPNLSGIAHDADPPIEWSETKNVRWKAPLPGQGLSTPIIWGDVVFIQCAVAMNEPKTSENSGADHPTEPNADQDPSSASDDATAPEAERSSNDDRRRDGRGNREGRRGRRGRGPRGETPTSTYRFELMALRRETGDLLWRRTLTEQVPHEGSHPDGSLAPASPATDGEHVYAYFGSRGLYCLNMKGDIVWQKDLGQMKTRNGFGEGSSPMLWQDLLIVNWDHEGDSFIVALDKRTGNQRWRKERDEPTSWATPYVLAGPADHQIVIPGSNAVRSYDATTGEIRWQCRGLGSNCIPMPVEDGGMVYVMSGHREPALLAIRHDGAQGDLTDSKAVTWKLDGGTPYVPSPLLYKDTLYLTQRNNGILSCLDPRTGQPHYDQKRLEEINGIYASLAGANDRVYIVGRNGVTYVLKRSANYEVLAINRLDDEFSASPAIVGDQLFLRGMKHLYCIAK